MVQGRFSRRRLLGRTAAMVVGAVGLSRAGDAFDHGHEAWTSLLRTYVNNGNVVYTEWVGDTRALDAYLGEVGAVTAVKFAAWSRNQQVAFLVNAYNALVIRVVLRHFPLESLASVNGGRALQKRDITLAALGPGEHAVEDIREHLASYKDARIHVALVPAARGGPELRTSAFRGDAVDSQLEDAAFGFVNDRARNQLDVAGGVIRLNAVFQAYRAQFEAEAGHLGAWVGRYGNAEDEVVLRQKGRTRVEFLPADALLNGR